MYIQSYTEIYNLVHVTYHTLEWNVVYHRNRTKAPISLKACPLGQMPIKVLGVFDDE